MEEKFRDEFERNEMNEELERNEEAKDILEKALRRIEEAEESGSQKPEDFKKAIAENIKIYMEMKGLTKDELAEKINVSMQELEWIMDGKWNPTLNEFFRLFEALQWQLNILIMINGEDSSEELDQ